MRISLYGPFPPNIGGVSAHVQRLAMRLRVDDNFQNIFVNNGGFSSTCKYPDYCIDVSDGSRLNLLKRIRNAKLISKGVFDVLHIHGSIYWDYIFVLILTRVYNKNIVFTLHDQIQLDKCRIILWITRLFYMLLPSKKLHFIAVNPNIKDQLISIGIKESYIKIIPAFLKENNEEELDENLVDILKQNSIKLLLYAPSLLTQENFDIYGIATTLEMYSRLIQQNITSLMLLICVPSGVEEKILKNVLSNYTIDQSSFFVYKKPVNNMGKLLELCDIYLRPTSTDGDSLLVREAILNQCVVVASDIVMRPQKTILFKTSNIDDFFNKMVFVLRELPQLKLIHNNNEDFFENIYSLYKNVICDESINNFK